MISALQSAGCMDEEGGKEEVARVDTAGIVSPSPPAGVDLNERRGGGTVDVTMAAEDGRLRREFSVISLPL